MDRTEIILFSFKRWTQRLPNDIRRVNRRFQFFGLDQRDQRTHHSTIDFVGCVTADCDQWSPHGRAEFFFIPFHLWHTNDSPFIVCIQAKPYGKAKPSENKIQETRFYAFYLLCARTLVWFIFLAIMVRDGHRRRGRSNNNACEN